MTGFEAGALPVPYEWGVWKKWVAVAGLAWPRRWMFQPVAIQLRVPGTASRPAAGAAPAANACPVAKTVRVRAAAAARPTAATASRPRLLRFVLMVEMVLADMTFPASSCFAVASCPLSGLLANGPRGRFPVPCRAFSSSFRPRYL